MTIMLACVILVCIAISRAASQNCGAVKQRPGGASAHRPAPERLGLVIAPAGDWSWHTDWLAGAPKTGRNWDLALIYYGDNESFTCPECVAVRRDRGAKWAVTSRFLTEEPGFQELTSKYHAITVMDDDLLMNATSLNTFFEYFVRLDLQLAQPSLCEGSFSFWGWVVNMRPGLLLHYTTFVELMAPTASSKFFDEVIRPSIAEAHTGWGLDFIWPFLAGWPKDKVAVMDAVCMEHAPKEGRRSVYDIELPIQPGEEWRDYLIKYNMTEDKAEAAGVLYNQPMVLDELPIDADIPSLETVLRERRSYGSPPNSGRHAILTYLAAVCIASVVLVQIYVRPSKARMVVQLKARQVAQHLSVLYKKRGH